MPGTFQPGRTDVSCRNPEDPFLLYASPREGNTLEAAGCFCAGFNHRRKEGEKTLIPVPLRDYRVSPCVACGLCRRPSQTCPQAEKDDSLRLFAHFLTAPLLVLAAPIYFYHLPAQLKALLDRCQFYYCASERGESLPHRREAFIILLAAREKGGQLFKGSLLTLTLALAPFNFVLAEPLLLRGLDAPGDLLKRRDYLEQLEIYGANAAESIC